MGCQARVLLEWRVFSLSLLTGDMIVLNVVAMPGTIVELIKVLVVFSTLSGVPAYTVRIVTPDVALSGDLCVL